MTSLYICLNFTFVGKNELVEETHTKGNKILTPILAVSFAQTPTAAPGLPSLYTDFDLQKATKFALELFVKGQKHD